MNRRAFLQTLGIVAAGVVLDPELLIWKPGAKTIFLPPTRAILTAPVDMWAGDMFTIGNVCSINPMTFKDTVVRQPFVVTADVKAGTDVTSLLWPPMRAEGVFQNVTREPFAHERVDLVLYGPTLGKVQRIEGM